MKNQNNKLRFSKSSITELSNQQLINVQGGSTAFCDTVMLTKEIRTIFYGPNN